MKRRFNIIILVLMTFLLSAFPFQYIQAASGSITPTASSRSINVGNSVTVTVRVSSASDIGAWQFNLNYDSGKLRYNSGPLKVADPYSYAGQKTASYSYSFTAIAAGTAVVSVSGAKIVGMDDIYMSVSGGSTSINIGTGTSTPTTPKPGTTTKPPTTTKPTTNTPINYSTNNDLSSLKVDGVELTPVFSKSVLEYSVELEPGTEKINITATAEDGKATITGAGEISVVEGANKLEVKVRAENGDEKTYVINAMVKEFDPIEVSIGKDKYTVIRKKGIVEAPKNYVETTALVNDIEVPAYKSDITKFILVGLKSETGDVGLYVYDETNETFRLYRELSFNGINFYPFLPESNVKIPKGYESFLLTIGENEIEAYRIDRTSKHSLIYGMNVDTGKTGFYLYDSEEGTLQRYNVDENLYYKGISDKYLIAVVILGTVVTALSATSGIMIYKYRKLKKINN